MFYNRFPYTDLQQKNLDWMIQTIKDGETAVENKIAEADTAIENAEAATEAANTAKTGADDAATAANNAATAANNAKDAANTAAANAQAAADKWATPYASTTVAGMTDHAKIYVYTGTEVGYTAGNWYYWNGSAWTSGGVYVGDISDAVLFTTAQSKTDDEKETARNNIDAVSADDFDSCFTKELVEPINWFDPSAIETGCYYWTNGRNENASYNSSGLIPVKSGHTYYFFRGNLTVAQGRSFFNVRFLVGYGSDGTTVEDSATYVGSSGYTVPSDVAYIRISNDSYIIAPPTTYTMVQESSSLIDFSAYFAPYLKYTLKDDVETIQNLNKVGSDKLIWEASASSLSANVPIVVCPNSDNKKNEYIEYKAFFSTFSYVSVRHGISLYGGGYFNVTDTVIQICSYDGTVVEEFTHGLTISDFIDIVCYTKNGHTCRSSITIMTAGGSYTAETTRFYSSRGSVLAVSDAAKTDVVMKYTVNDGNEDVWVFGDSYISMGDPQRWASIFVGAGHKKVLFSGFGGAQSADEIKVFREYIAKKKPKYIVWLLGMNDGDSGAVNSSWKTCVDEVIATCEEYNITPILATIPCVPSIDHTYKNAYVIASGCRYVDFAKAVDAESAGATWYTGMLSGDNTHPTALGASALMYQFMLDVPEALYNEE